MILHRSVLLDETIQLLNVLSNKHYVDCTLGGGGHAEAILERNGPKGSVIVFELDSQTIKRTSKRLSRFGSRLIVIRENFRNILQANSYKLQASGILYDLGLSTDVLKSSGRGFSFLADEPLDMRFDEREELRASDIVNSWRERDLADMIYAYGEERYSRRIAKAIVETRRKHRIEKTGDLVAVIEKAVPPPYRRGRIHCATRTFQAIRIAVNEELEGLKQSLTDAFEILESGGRIVVITFHSLEDRIVKHYFKSLSAEKKGVLLTKKPIVPTEEEVKLNPASRSAKLRGIQKL